MENLFKLLLFDCLYFCEIFDNEAGSILIIKYFSKA